LILSAGARYSFETPGAGVSTCAKPRTKPSMKKFSKAIRFIIWNLVLKFKGSANAALKK
jgi:hypothetical protein